MRNCQPPIIRLLVKLHQYGGTAATEFTLTDALMMKVSVIIPAYNEETYLPATLKHVQRASSIMPCPSETIVVDNDSEDKTKQVAESFGAKVFLETCT